MDVTRKKNQPCKKIKLKNKDGTEIKNKFEGI
jgi:hypothetical protein